MTDLQHIRTVLHHQSKFYPALAQYYATVYPRIPPDVLKILPFLGLIIVPPDGVMLQVHKEILTRYESEIVFVDLWRQGMIEAERLYHDGLNSEDPKRRIGSWWIKNKVFAAGGDAVTIVLRSADMGLLDRLLLDKGASDPALAAPGSMRFRYATPSKTFGVVHCSDDWFSLLFELWVALGFDRLTSLPMATPPTHKIRLLASHTPTFAAPRIPYYRALFALKRRIIFRLLSGSPQITAVELEQLSALYAAAEAVVERQHPFKEERELISRVLGAEKALWADVTVRSQGCEPLAAALLAFCDEKNFASLQFTAWRAVLAANGVSIDAMDATIVESVFHFYG